MDDRIFVIGAGTMGLDIAAAFAEAGYAVTVRDVSESILNKAGARLGASLRKRAERGKLTEGEAEAILSRLSFTVDMAAAADAVLVVEAIVENIGVKKEVFAELDSICGPETILASNTSSISITEIASATKRPDRCIGMHFFNPATKMKLVEVVRGTHASDETYGRVCGYARSLGKETIEVNECPGFVVNRLLIPMINEAIGLFAEGAASAADIDTAMRLGCNHPMGPLELADLIGLDVVLAISDTLYDELRESKYRAHPLLRKYVRGGILGRKSKQGFFKYE